MTLKYFRMEKPGTPCIHELVITDIFVLHSTAYDDIIKLNYSQLFFITVLPQIHSRGLKFGLYQNLGTKTCAGYPGVLGNEENDARQFAEWGVDYVKLDGCYLDVRHMDKGKNNIVYQD